MRRDYTKSTSILFSSQKDLIAISSENKKFWIGRPASLNDAVSDYMLEGKFCRDQTNFVEKGLNDANPLN